MIKFLKFLSLKLESQIITKHKITFLLDFEIQIVHTP